MFALKMSLKEERKKMLLFSCALLLSVISKIKSGLNYVHVYCALLFVDYQKSSRKGVSGVRLRVVVKVVFGIMVVGEKIMK